MKAIVIGATGATGKPLTEQLLNHTHFSEVLVFVRKPLRFSHPKLKVEVIDFDRPETWADKVSGDVLFSCLGTTLKQAGSQANQYKIDFTYQHQFAQIAQQNGVKRFVLVSSASANASSKWFYMRLKGELENAVMALDFQELTIFRPPLLIRPNSDRLGERISEHLLSLLNTCGLFLAHRPLPTEQLATAMIHAVLSQKTGILEKEQIWKLVKSALE